MSISEKVAVALRQAPTLEEFGRANIAFPDGLYIIPSEPALSSPWPLERRRDGSAARRLMRSALSSFLRRRSSSRRPRH